MKKSKGRIDSICDICMMPASNGMTWTEAGTKKQYCRECMAQWFPDAKPIKDAK